MRQRIEQLLRRLAALDPRTPQAREREYHQHVKGEYDHQLTFEENLRRAQPPIEAIPYWPAAPAGVSQ